MKSTYSTGKRAAASGVRQGMAILFAVLLAGSLAAVAAAVQSIAARETILSTFTEDTNRALANADSMVECLVYNDVRVGAFASTTQTTVNCGAASIAGNVLPAQITPPLNPEFSVVGQSLRYPSLISNPAAIEITYDGAAANTAAYGYVTKTLVWDPVYGAVRVKTVVTASGWNGLPTNPSPRTVERGVQISY